MDNSFTIHEPECDDVDQRVIAEAFVKVDIAADVRYADRIAVRRDAIDDALRDVAAMLIVQRSEA